MATAERKRRPNPNISLGQMTKDLSQAADAAKTSAEPVRTAHATVAEPKQPANELQAEASEGLPETHTHPGGPVGRPRTAVRSGPSKCHGLQPGFERFSVIVDSEQLDTLRDIAWNSRRTLKELVGDAIGAFIASADASDKVPRPKK